ncbi:MAG: homoserine kinase [Elainella sp.]
MSAPDSLASGSGKPPSVTVTVPATTANLGPGFDCLGAALSLYNHFEFNPLPGPEPLHITATGLEAAQVDIDTSNLAYQAFCHLYQQIGQLPPPVHLAIHLSIPLARGLGSSATAIVGGLVGANVLAGSPLSPAAVMELAISLEGHPDNVVPALLGGCRLAATQPAQSASPAWSICDVPWHPEILPVVAIPNFELSTAEARRVLPASYSRQDTIFNAAHLGMLLRALETGQSDWLRTALQDRVHQPYRQALIPGYEAVQSAALEAGACGLVISGAGPTLLALAGPTSAEAVKAAMQTAWEDSGITAVAQILPIDPQGTVVKSTELSPNRSS